MADREKVIKGIECLLTDRKCDLFNCPYADVGSCINAVLSDALSLLKEQQHQIWEMQDRTEYLEDELKSQPQIVRCKDCKHYLQDGVWKCRYFNGCSNSGDWYCADGEARQ